MTKEELMRKAIELSVRNVAEGGAHATGKSSPQVLTE